MVWAHILKTGKNLQTFPSAFVLERLNLKKIPPYDLISENQKWSKTPL